MEIRINRKYLKDTYTIGVLEIKNDETGAVEPLCDTMEPRAINWHEEMKKAGKTAIPEGRYRIKMLHSKTFKRVMPYLLNVPHFVGIMLHTGSTVDASKGCILVGRNTERGVLTQSRICFNELVKRITDATERGEEVWITVQSPNQWTA